MKAKIDDLIIAYDNFVTEIVRNVHSGYFDCRGSFQTTVDLYCCAIMVI